MGFRILTTGKDSYDILDVDNTVARIIGNEDQWDAMIIYPMGMIMDMTLYKSEFEDIESLCNFVTNEIESMKKIMGV